MYSKNELKRMFLRVLYEIQYGSMTDCSNSVASIVSSWFKRYWNVNLSEEEQRTLNEAVKEMQLDGLIQSDKSQRSGDLIALTELGKDVVERQLDPDSRARKYF